VSQVGQDQAGLEDAVVVADLFDAVTARRAEEVEGALLMQPDMQAQGLVAVHLLPEHMDLAQLCDIRQDRMKLSERGEPFQSICQYFDHEASCDEGKSR